MNSVGNYGRGRIQGIVAGSIMLTINPGRILDRLMGGVIGKVLKADENS